MLRKLPALFVTIAPVSLGALLGLGGASWLVQTAIAPQIAQAYTAKVDVSLDHQLGESYQTMLRRAEAVARAAAQRSFDQDILVTEVSVMVLVQNQGTIAPVLSLEASRQEWRNSPDPRRWAKYYSTAESLLQLGDTTVSPAVQQGNESFPDQSPSPPTPLNVQPTNPRTLRNPRGRGTPIPQQGTTPQTSPQVVPLPTPATR